MTVTTIACNEPATLTPSTIDGDATFRPDSASTSYTFAAWVSAPVNCINYMTYELDAGTMAFAETVTNINENFPLGPAFSLAGASNVNWNPLMKTTIVATVYAKTAKGVRVTTAGKFATKSLYIADPACDAVTITQTSTTSHVNYELSATGADQLF